MRLDEMIIKANTDGKTYINDVYHMAYSRDAGFVYTSNEPSKPNGLTPTNGWEELPKRHLTVSEAEKELYCVIDTPDISKLFISSDILPEDGLKIVLFGESRRHCYSGFYDASAKAWRTEYSGAMVTKPSLYIKWSDLIKFIPKE